ncbi:MAG TPA: hypothetical protein VFZ77_23230 [Acidimicrobiales bacterium]
MARHTGTGPPPAPVPPGWPGDDPTLPEELSVLDPAAGRRGRGRHARRRPAGSPGATGGPLGAGVPGRDAQAGEPSDDPGPGGAPAGLGVEGGRHEPAGHEADGRFDDDLVAGVQPAGRVLVVVVLGLLLAMLVNADALVERAERRPPGPARDRALAIWHPVQDVSHALQLHRVRDLADRLAGDDGDQPGGPLPTARDRRRAPGGTPGTAPAPGATAGHDAAGEPPPAEPALRTPTADEPLRVWIGGDSMAEVFGRSLAGAAEGTGVVDATLHYEMASGLTRPDYHDWPAALAADVEAGDPEVLVVLLGANDGQGILLPDGTPVPEVADPRWADEYGRRVGALMDQLRADDRWVVWVTQPPMREPGYDARMAVVRRVHQAEAATRPWVTLVDSPAVLGGEGGAYTPTRPGPDGAEVPVRREDGIHLTQQGADMLAAHVLGVIAERVDLPAGDDAVGG